MIETPNVSEVLDRGQPTSNQDMYNIVTGVLGRYLQPVEDIDALLSLDPYRDPNTGEITNEKVRYELRRQTFYFSEVGIVGKISQRAFERLVDFAYQQQLGGGDGPQRTGAVGLRDEQPNCTWTLVGAQHHRVNLKMTREVPYDGDSLSVANVDAIVAKSPQMNGSTEPGESVALNRRRGHLEIPDYRLVVVCIFADLSRGRLVDPAPLVPGGRPGPMTDYSRSRLLRDLTDSQRTIREEIEAWMRKFYGAAPIGRPTAPPPTPPAAPKPRAAKPGRKPGRKKAGTTTPPPAIATPAVNLDAFKTQILQLRTNGQMNEHQIVEAMEGRVSLEDVRAVLNAR